MNMDWDRCSKTLSGVSVPTINCIGDLIVAVLNGALALAGVIIITMIIIAGYKFITSRGDATALDSARKTVIYAVAGLFVVMLSYAFISIVVNLLTGRNFRDFLWFTGARSGGGCFLADTKIRMSDGSQRAIQDIQVGEMVYSYDEKTKQVVSGKVTKTYIHTDNKDGYYIINEKLKATPNHPMWVVNSSSYKRADSLKTGDTLLTTTGDTITVSSIEYEPGTNTVYNLHIEGKNHNYFAEDILVHNK